MQRAVTSLLFSTLPLATLGCLIPLSTQAQVTPDGTTSTTVNQNGNNFTIEQGDRVGDNLFHSFNQFSVPTLGSAAFNNAGDIANIFSRVTGSSISSIDGLISANGTANLFLINPNGIIFGENASLNLGGSFFASTADSLLFEGNTEFSASNPQAPPLLEVSIPIGANFRDNPGDIINQGNLAVKQDLTLSGGNLDLQGQLEAGGDLTLQATDTVKIRDSVNNPFIAAANGQLLVQGNQNVDIFALNHPNSGLFSGGDLILRSANAVSGDAHYWSGGNFKIEQLNENLGNFVSLFDPIVFANGDISFDSYEGASLHILAGGSVNINSIVITGTGTADDSINPTNTPELANVTLSDGTELTIDGSTQPTVDIRAGIDWTQLGGLPGNSSFGVDIPSEVFGASATSGDINIGSIDIAAPNGLVFLTNQYLPNISLPESNIQVETILTGDRFFDFSGKGGSVIIDSRQGLDVTKQINTSSELGDAGNINLLAGNTISLKENVVVQSNTFGTGRGGDINVRAKFLTINNGADIASRSVGQGKAGNLSITTDSLLSQGVIGSQAQNVGDAGDVSIKTKNLNLENDAVISSGTSNQGNAGNLSVDTDKLTVNSGATINASNFVKNGNGGNGGNINIKANSIELTGSSENNPSNIEAEVGGGATGVGGKIDIETKRLSIQDGAYVSTSTDGIGKAGDLSIRADEIEVGGLGSIASQVNPEGQGDGGNLTIDTQKLTATDSAQISASTLNVGNAGNLKINTRELSVLNGAQIQALTLSVGRGGNLEINASDFVELSGTSPISIREFPEFPPEFSRPSLTIEQGGYPSGIFTDSYQAFGDPSRNGGNAGEVKITTQNLIVRDGAIVSAGNINSNPSGTSAIGNNKTDRSYRSSAILLFTKIGDTPKLDTNNWRSNITINTGGAATPGNTGLIEIIADSIKLDRGNIQASTQVGESGNIDLKVKDILLLDNNSLISTRANRDANGGKIFITSPKIEISNNSSITANNLGNGRGGDITLNVNSINLRDRGSISTQTNSNQGGNINLQNTDLILMRRGSQISTNAGTAGAGGDGGNITINEQNNPKGLIIAFPNENNDITANAFTGAGGRLEINSLGLFGIQPLSRKELANLLQTNEPNQLDPQRLQSNDITAISQQNPNLQEQVNINTDIDPTTGLINLPASVGDASDQISQNPCQRGVGSEFIVTGKGGLPPNVNESLNSESAQVGLIETVISQPQTVGANAIRPNPNNIRPNPSTTSEAVPAQGWVFNDKGEVTLTAYKTTNTGRQSLPQTPINSCSAP
jgi:filamentous hemagglutinin family protein